MTKANNDNRARIWLVDDDQDDQLLIHSAFQECLPTTPLLILSDGDEVLPALTKAALLPELILMDINMERQNGFETLQQLRQKWPQENLPIIIFSTSTAEIDQDKAIQLGANNFLTKPSSYHGLHALIGKLVQDWQLGTSADSLTVQDSNL